MAMPVLDLGSIPMPNSLQVKKKESKRGAREYTIHIRVYDILYLMDPKSTHLIESIRHSLILPAPYMRGNLMANPSLMNFLTSS